MLDTLKAIEGYLASKADHGDLLASALHKELVELLPKAGRAEAAFLCADWVMTAYTRASEDNGGFSSVEWETIDYAHEAAREAFTDEEIERFNEEAKEFNGWPD